MRAGLTSILHRLRSSRSLCALWFLVAGVAVVTAAKDVRLVDAVKHRDKTAVRALLNERVDVNAADAEGMTALHWAAHWDDFETAKLLMRAGASAKAANRYGVTPLHEACTVG